MENIKWGLTMTCVERLGMGDTEEVSLPAAILWCFPDTFIWNWDHPCVIVIYYHQTINIEN